MRAGVTGDGVVDFIVATLLGGGGEGGEAHHGVHGEGVGVELVAVAFIGDHDFVGVGSWVHHAGVVAGFWVGSGGWRLFGRVDP